jgi:nitrogen regulatory protein PII-like uncharacterized protein
VSTTEQQQFVVEVVEDETGKIVAQSKPTSERRAEKIEDGYGINLNWEKFSTRVVPVDEAGKIE